MLVKEIEQDGEFVLAVEGQSTLPQTIFNSIKCVPPSPRLSPQNPLFAYPSPSFLFVKLESLTVH